MPQYNYDQIQKGYRKSRDDRRHQMIFRGKLFIIFGIPALAIIVALFMVRIYHIEGPSMEPSLHDNQRVLIQKWDKTWAALRGKSYAPERFDVVVIKIPSEKTQVIKRVIGLPGDRVFISGGEILIINKQHPEGYLVDNEAPVDVREVGEYTEGEVDLVLGDNEIYVLGDNRESSEDSRLFGPVKTSDVIGKVLNL